MRSLAIRITDSADAAAIRTLMEVTHSNTASKALLKAAHRYPEEIERRREAELCLAAARRDLDALRTAVRTWGQIRNEERSAAAKLEELSDR